MNRSFRIADKRGTTLLELIIGMIITSIIVWSVYKVWHGFDLRTTREKYKTELQRDIIAVTNLIERDIRRAGFGLPGNGIYVNLDDDANDEITFYNNDNATSTILAQHAQPVHTTIYVNDASIFTAGAAVCLAGTDTIYRTIQHAGVSATSDDTLMLIARINTAQPLWAGSTTAYPAMSIGYEISNDPVALTRTRDGAGMSFGKKLDSIKVEPKDDNGNILAGTGKEASVISIITGGYVGKGGNRVFLAESTEVNIRNNF